MVAGFNSIEGGKIYFNDKVINNVPPKDRNIGMVFQNYAIFPHLTVRKNIAFTLKYFKTFFAKKYYWGTVVNSLKVTSLVTLLSILLATPLAYIMTTAIYIEVLRGNYGVAAAIATVLTLITIISLLILFKVTGNKEISM